MGNPTILATFAVIAALLPMAFVSGLMGPYMRPIPVGASAAMLLSLLIAFIISPWLSFIVLTKTKPGNRGEKAEGRLLCAFNRIYERNLRGLLESRKKRLRFFVLVIALLIAAFLLVPAKLTRVKMLPFDNKSELQVVIDMPEGTSLEETQAATSAISEYLKSRARGSELPDLRGHVRPFQLQRPRAPLFLEVRDRPGGHPGQLRARRDERKSQSHDIARRIRPPIQAIADKWNARAKIVEIPPVRPSSRPLSPKYTAPISRGRSRSPAR